MHLQFLPDRLEWDCLLNLLGATEMKRGETDATQAKQSLRDAGLRATAARVAVYRQLAAHGGPMSHADVVESLEDFGFDQSTLFRCLNEMADAELLARLDLGTKPGVLNCVIRTKWNLPIHISCVSNVAS